MHEQMAESAGNVGTHKRGQEGRNISLKRVARVTGREGVILVSEILKHIG
jgi:hypothetical protein